jgi:hypothetical protein
MEVMDFSQAERNGFCRAFRALQREILSSTDTDEELEARADRILKGCEEHFLANVTRISRISSIIPPESKGEFAEMATALLAPTMTSKQFVEECSEIVKKFPGCEPWLQWWMIPEHAMMLFPSEKRMHPRLWIIIPHTTNAGESQHNRLYHATGKDFPLIEGLDHLAHFFDWLATLSQSVKRESFNSIYMMHMLTPRDNRGNPYPVWVT